MTTPILKITNDGTKIWTVDGKRHREDGPAVDFGPARFWYINDVLHREDGPAVEFDDAKPGWYLNGRVYSFQDYIDVLNKSPDEKMVLMLKYS